MIRLATATLVLLGAAPASAAGDPMEPYKMVRSLQLVQDQLARGDHAALPMQHKLLDLTDERFRTTGAEELADPHTVPALLVYAMSGGNPTTLEVVLSKLPADDPRRPLAQGVLAYMTGKLVKASELLAPFDPMAQEGDVGAYLALVKGSVLVAKQPGAALGLMDQARLLAPGTLVEEAALRRSLPACVALGQPERFMRMAEQYTRRFLRSPYASEFADAFVDGLVAFHDRITSEQIDGIVSLMKPVQQEAIYLRLARRSTIRGHVERSAFAADKARAIARGEKVEEDPRATFYAALSSITSDNYRDVLATLEGVDAGQLSPRDRRLLLAARAIAAEMLAPPATETASAATAKQQLAAPPVEEATVPAVVPEPPHAALAEPASARAEEAAAGSAAAVPPEAPPEVAGGESELAVSVRQKLEAIDRMLEEETQ